MTHSPNELPRGVRGRSVSAFHFQLLGTDKVNEKERANTAPTLDRRVPTKLQSPAYCRGGSIVRCAPRCYRPDHSAIDFYQREVDRDLISDHSPPSPDPHHSL